MNLKTLFKDVVITKSKGVDGWDCWDIDISNVKRLKTREKILEVIKFYGAVREIIEPKVEDK